MSMILRPLQWLRSVVRKGLPYVVAYGAKMLMRGILRTCKIEVQGIDVLEATIKQGPCIAMLWHQHIVLVPEIFTRYAPNHTYTAVISKSRDGDPLAIIAKSYPQGRALRVPHNARHIALTTMIDTLKRTREVLIITPDGPRGPQHQVKPGIVVAAQESSAAIVPFSWTADRHWTLNTWDHMLIPKPFATIHASFGPPITLPHSGDQDFARDTARLEHALLHPKFPEKL